MFLHRSRVARVFLTFTAPLVALLLVVGTALAHEHREVGPFEFVVGWTGEPALVEQPNGLDLRISTHADGQPVVGLEDDLTVEVIFGDKRMPLPLRARFGQPGAYTSDVIPTRAGSYLFHITGAISGTQIDETFNSADGEFSDVEGLTTIQFPESVSEVGSMQAQVAEAQAAANTARMLGIGGLVTGLLGTALGVIAANRRRVV